MSSSSSTTIFTLFGNLFFWAFVLVKAFGTSLAAWSWWWVLAPIVPVIGEIIIRYGL